MANACLYRSLLAGPLNKFDVFFDHFCMLTFENVSKNFGKFSALKELNFQVSAGEFVSIIGPSGAGKSTLINLLLCFEKPSKGTIQIDDIVLNKLTSRSVQFYRRHIGVVFQDYKLLEKKTVSENIAFALIVSGYPKEQIPEKVREVLDRVSLLDKKDKFPWTLSGGEKQRISIARALIHNPSLFLADEPTGNLDPKASAHIVDILKDICKSGTTVVLTTHNKEIVDTLNQRVIRLDQGQISSDVENSWYIH